MSAFLISQLDTSNVGCRTMHLLARPAHTWAAASTSTYSSPTLPSAVSLVCPAPATEEASRTSAPMAAVSTAGTWALTPKPPLPEPTPARARWSHQRSTWGPSMATLHLLAPHRILSHALAQDTDHCRPTISWFHRISLHQTPQPGQPCLRLDRQAPDLKRTGGSSSVRVCPDMQHQPPWTQR